MQLDRYVRKCLFLRHCSGSDSCAFDIKSHDIAHFETTIGVCIFCILSRKDGFPHRHA